MGVSSAAHDSDFADNPTHMPLPPARLARAVVAAVFVGLTAIGFLRILYEQRPDALGVTVSFSCIVALLLLQLLWFSGPPARLRSPAGYLALFVQACLVFLPMIEFSDAWAAMPGFLAGSMLLVLPQVLAWPGFVGVVATMAFLQSQFGGEFGGRPLNVVYVSISTVVTGFVVYGLSRLAQLVVELHAARAEMAKMAVVRERLRFARDLHDLLGYSLSAITLKSELTHRLVTKNPAQAREELVEILSIARQALADVRTVSSSYRELSLEDECRSARWVLASADIEVRMSTDYRDLPAPVSTVLATVLREGITNLLRHSKAEWCEIRVRQTGGVAGIEIINNGVRKVPSQSGEQGGGGGGLQNLSRRAAELGGEVLAGRVSDDQFRLKVSIPLGVGKERPRAKTTAVQ
jgi:signal transduction histidine kinase